MQSNIEDNKALVLAFVDLCFVQRKPREAFERYTREDYMQHNPLLCDGRESPIRFLEAIFRMGPEGTFELKHSLAEGDKVMVCGIMKEAPHAPGAAIVDIFRVQDGLIAEHWDVAQSIPSLRLNPRPML